jgi:hypothetical protein
MTHWHTAACLAAIVSASGGVCAQSPGKQFSYTINQGEIAEECVKLAAGATLDYAFEATDRVDFNIRYYLGNNIVYPVRGNQVRRIADRFTAPSGDEYCLMWSNKTPQAVTVKGTLSH